MDFEALKEELGNRGFDYLEDERLGAMINRAYRDICNLHIWPFVITQDTGLTGAGNVNNVDPPIRRILFASDYDNVAFGRVLQKTTLDDLMEDGVTDITETGTPEFYYQAFANEVRTYPVGGTLFIRYAQRVPPMENDSDEPLFDEEYHHLIVDGAAIYCYEDSDNFNAASSLRVILDQRLAAMGEDYQINSRDPSYMTITNPQDG